VVLGPHLLFLFTKTLSIFLQYSSKIKKRKKFFNKLLTLFYKYGNIIKKADKTDKFSVFSAVEKNTFFEKEWFK